MPNGDLMQGTFYYTYILECVDGTWYVGSTANLKQRLSTHQSGHVHTTARRLPIALVYYEACREKKRAEQRERYFKTGFGRAFLKGRIGRMPL